MISWVCGAVHRFHYFSPLCTPLPVVASLYSRSKMVEINTEVQWRVTCQSTKPGDTVCIVGSYPAIGAWNLSSCVPLATDSKSFPVWYGTLKLTCPNADDDVVEYKYIIRHKDFISWENIEGNRRLRLHSNGLCRVEESWGSLEKTTVTFQTDPKDLKHRLNNQQKTKQHNTGDSGANVTSMQEQPVTRSPTRMSSKAVQNAEALNPTKRSQPSYLYRPHTVKNQELEIEVKPEMMFGYNDSSDDIYFGSPERYPGPYNPNHYPTAPSTGTTTRTTTSIGSTETRHSTKPRGRFRRDVLILSNSGRLNDRYAEKDVVGRGTWGEVKVVVEKATGGKRACKKIPKCYVEDIDRFRQEIDLMKSLDHPNIVRLFETFEDVSDIHLVMEYCSGGR